jgi:hypothetical protein
MKKYRIKYRVILEGASPLEDKEIKIDKCMSSLHAQVRLEDYLKKKYINFKQLIVTECKEALDMNDVFSQFGDIFGGNTDFKKYFGGI